MNYFKKIIFSDSGLSLTKNELCMLFLCVGDGNWQESTPNEQNLFQYYFSLVSRAGFSQQFNTFLVGLLVFFRVGTQFFTQNSEHVLIFLYHALRWQLNETGQAGNDFLIAQSKLLKL